MSEYNKIYSISDIHSDAENLLIQFRDNCKLIKKKGIKDKLSIDTDFINIMNKPYLNDVDVLYNSINPDGSYNQHVGSDDYVCDWNYEWTAKDTLCVICGDILDGYRPNFSYEDPLYYTPDGSRSKVFGEYPFEELKIIEFLCAMQRQAVEHNSKLVVVYGNHDIINMYSYFLSSHVSPYTKKNFIDHKIYGKEIRVNMFKVGSYTYDIMCKLDMCLIFKYKNYLFMHARLLKYSPEIVPIQNFIDQTNMIINNEKQFVKDNRKNVRQIVFNNDYSNTRKDCEQYYLYFLELNKLLSIYQLTPFSENREYAQYPQVCNLLISDLHNYDLDITNTTIIVGHSINSSHFLKDPLKDSLKPTKSTLNNICTFKNYKETIDNKSEIYILSDDYVRTMDNNISSESDCKKFNNINITFDCNIGNAKYPQLYRIDCGSSRSFIKKSLINDFKSKKSFEVLRHDLNIFISNIPQTLLLEKSGDNYLPKLVKSTIRNMFINRTCYNFNDEEKEIFISLLERIKLEEQGGGSYYENHINNDNIKIIKYDDDDLKNGNIKFLLFNRKTILYNDLDIIKIQHIYNLKNFTDIDDEYDDYETRREKINKIKYIPNFIFNGIQIKNINKHYYENVDYIDDDEYEDRRKDYDRDDNMYTISGYDDNNDNMNINLSYEEILELLKNIIINYDIIHSKIIHNYKKNKIYDQTYKSSKSASSKKPKLFYIGKRVIANNILKVNSLKSLAYHIECPKELIPNNNICPKNFPIIISNCCTKDIYKSSTYKPNLDFVSKVINYSYEQQDALKSYTRNGYIILSNLTTNNFKVDDITIKSLTLNSFNIASSIIYDSKIAIGNKKINEDINDYMKRLYQHALTNFYNLLKSCFIEKCEENLILYRGVTTKNSYEVGSFVQFNTFISTSLNQEIANGFLDDYGIKGTMFIIYVPKGTKLCYILDLMNEKEILINCFSIFYIKSCVKNLTENNIIEMVLIDRNEPNY